MSGRKRKRPPVVWGWENGQQIVVHASARWARDLPAIRIHGLYETIKEMGGVVEAQIRSAIYALAHLSVESAIQASDLERRVNALEVEIDRETGRVALMRYTAVDDYGVLVNPMIAAGQAHGAMAQGIGQALLEHAVYDPRSGQMVAGSFMDYALPRADDLPSFDLGFNGTPCTTNPLGVKGCGEAGAIAAFPAIANAILDALAPFGVEGFDGPATPDRIWQAMRQAEAR